MTDQKDILPTIVVLLDGSPVTINESDFDPAVHKLAKGRAEPVVEPVQEAQ